VTGKEEHPFTISSAPQVENIHLTIKDLGNYTAKLADLDPGCRVLLDGPYGTFTPEPGGPAKLFIAGGIGITPFMSVLGSWSGAANVSPVTLLWTVKKENDLVDLAFFQALDRECRWLTVKTFVTRPGDGGQPARINRDVLEQYVTGAGMKVYLCGPVKMTGSLIKQVRALGVRRRNIHFERFGF